MLYLEVTVVNNKLPENVTLQDLKEYYAVAYSNYTKAVKNATILDAADRGRIWQAVKAKFPKYQILTDTNHVAYVKSNLVASLYSMGKHSNILPTSDEDKQIVQELNIAIENQWSTAQIGYYQMKAGDRAALMNLGITQVGWDNSILGGSSETSSWYKGQTTLKNLDPIKFKRDPFAEDLDSSNWCCYEDTFHKSVILRNKNYRAAFKEYLANHKSSATSTQSNEKYGDVPNKQTSATKDHYKIITHWIIDEDEVHEIHTVDNEYILFVKENIRPKGMLPFAELYCNDPQGDLFGTSEPGKIFANSLAYNLMTSILMTAEYKNQRPPRFISTNSGLNLNSFKKYGNEADYTFIVNGDASRAVHYQAFPQASNVIGTLMSTIGFDIGKVTGVDDRYTGRDTGSIITTGGTEAMLDQVTMIDQPKINHYNKYAERLSKLVLLNMIEFSQKRKYFVKDPSRANAWKTIEVDFPSIKPETLFSYETDVSSELPKNKQRLAQWATVLMEKQMQYAANGGKVEFITPEEWLMFQDSPNKEFMMERMGIQRNEDYVEMVAQTVFQYASLTEKGMSPEDALVATAETLRYDRTPGAMEQDAAPETPIMGPADQGLPPMT